MVILALGLRGLRSAEHLLDDALAHALAVCTGHDVRAQIAHVASAAQDGNAVAYGQRLAELVSDEHDGNALVPQAAQELEERRDLARGKHGRGLVEEQHAGAPEKDFDDLDPLPLAER